MTHAMNNRGFSLIEVLVSISIFLITAGALAASTVAAIKANMLSGDVSVATTLVQEKIEFFRALDPSRAADQAQMVSGTDTVNETATVGTRYRRTWTVTNDTPKYAMATVRVMVEWSSPSRRAINAVTYVCRLPSCA
jgi:prepilin-type N-terminal cleavage/methylation domain-containing protein